MINTTSLSSVLFDSLKSSGNKLAHIEYDRDRLSTEHTFEDVLTQALKLASYFQKSCIVPGEHVALIMSNQSRWSISALSILFSGAVIIPIDYKLTDKEVLGVIDHSGAKVVITEGYRWRSLAKGAVPKSVARWVISEPISDLTENVINWEDAQIHDPISPIVSRGEADIACVVYSSGTSGEPKGCMLTHKNYLFQAEIIRSSIKMTATDRYFSVLPSNHAVDFMSGFIISILNGSVVIFQRTLRPEYFMSTIIKAKITHLILVPLILNRIKIKLSEQIAALPLLKRSIINFLLRLNAMVTRNGPHYGFSRFLLAPLHKKLGGSLHTIIVGSAFVDPKTVKFFNAIGIKTLIGYGLTEAGTVLTLSDQNNIRYNTVGLPVKYAEIEIRNPSDEGVGEIWVNSPTVMAGYFREPELTSEVIQDGWLNTGDLGLIESDGNLIIKGRSKNMIVTEGGKNVYPEDIEVMFENIDGLKEFAIYSRDYLWGKDSAESEALYMVVHLEATESIDKIINSIMKQNLKLKDFKRVHSIVDVDFDFPRTASTKIKRAELKNIISETKEGVYDIHALH